VVDYALAAEGASARQPFHETIANCQVRDPTPNLEPLTATAAVVRGDVQGVGFRDATLRHARELGVMGWVRNGDDGTVRVHAEGPQRAVEELVAFLHAGPPRARVSGVTLEGVATEGHEQFAIRGVGAGVFVVQEPAP
jgi:acylphosphatase